jgi:hypothetical protein
MYELNGEEITLETLQSYANEFGMDVDSYIEFMKGQGLVEKTEGVAATDAAVTPTTDTESASENIFSELPEVTKEDVGLGERYFVDRFNKTYEGIGYKATQATENEVQAAGFGTTALGSLLSGSDKEYIGDFRDFVTIASPPDADGNVSKKTVRVDRDFGIPRFGFGEKADEVGSMQQFLGINFGGKTADEINEFIQSNLKNSNVNPETYSYAWNMANTKPVVIDGKEKKLDDLSSEELGQHVENIFTDIIGSGNIPGAQKIQEDIEPEIQKFSNELLEVYKEKVANGELDYQEATNEFNEAVSKRYGELFEESDEWKKLTSTLEKAVGSRFNKDFTDKIRIEAENEHLPDWVANNFSEDFVRQAYITSRIKIPKTIDETQILFRTRDLNDVREEIKELSLNPEAKYDSDGEPTNFVTNQDRINYLESREARLNQLIGNDLLQQNEYQQKLKDLKVPSAFGKTIDDPDLTIDEWQGMLGDQTVQMIGAMFSLGGSTFVQEGGGAAFEILEVEAAKKMKGMSIEDFFGKDPDDVEGVKKKFNLDDSGNKKPTSEDIEMKLKAFRALPFEDVIENGKVKVKGRKSRIQDIIDSGEVNMTEAIFVGGITAGLDLVSTFSTFKGATKLIPKSLLRDVAKGRFTQAYKTLTKPTKDVFGKKAASPAKTIGVVTGIETVTEMAQEVTSMSGVKAATGYFPSKDKALKRIYEAGAQALLTTGPITVGGQTVTTTFNETVLTRIKGLPQTSMRQAINARKDQLRQQNAAGFITEDQMLDQFTELEAIENSIGTLKLSNKLNLEERIEVVNLFKKVKEEQDKVDEIKKNFDEKKNEELLQEKDQVISEEELAILEGETAVKKAQDKIRKVFFANSFRTNGMRLAELINTADKGPLKDSKMFVFDTPEEARYNLEVLGFSQDQNGRWRFKGKFTKRSESNLINRIVNGSANAGFFNMQGLSKTGIFVTKNINEKIDQGVLNAFNAVQHETMHGLSSDLTFEQLKAITEGLTKEMKAGDAKMQAALKQVQRILKDLELSKDSRTYHDEFLGYLSDTFHALDINQEYLTKDNAASLFNMSKYFQTGYQELLNTSPDVVKMSPSQLIDFIRGFNINKQTVNISMPKGVDAQEEVRPAQKQGSLLSEQLYQQLTRDFENAVEEYSSLVGEEEAKTLAANIAATNLQGETFNRIPKILLEGFTQEDLQDVVVDFISDPKVLAKKGEEYNKIKNRGVVGLLKKYNVGFEGGVMGYLNSKQGGYSIFDLRLAEFVRAHPSYGNITISTAQEGAIGTIDQVTESLSPEDILIQQEEQTQQEERQSRDGTIMLHEQAEKAGIPLTPAFEEALKLFTDLYQEGKLTETGLKDLKKKFPKEYNQVYSLVQEAFGVEPKPGNLTQTDIQNSQQKMQIATPTFFRKHVFMKQYTAGVAKVDEKGDVVFDKDNNVVIDKDTQYLATGVPSGLQTQRVTQANNIKVAEDLFYETIMRMADKGPQKGKLIPKRPKNLVIKKLKNFDDKFFNENMGIIRGEVNVKQKQSNMSQKHKGMHHMIALIIMSQAARQNMEKGRDFDMLADGLPSSLASDFIYKLDPELFKEFMGTYQAINDVMGVYANNYDKSSLKDVLRNKLSAAFSNPMITKLTNVLDPIYAQYSVDLAKVEKGLITVEELPTLNQTLETELVQDIVLSNTLDIRNDDGTKAQSMDEVWSNIGHVTKMRQSTSLFAEKLISDFGQQKGLELIIKYLLPSVVGSGKIGDGRFDVIDGVLVEVGIEKAGRNRKKLFKNLEDFFNSDHGINKLLDDYLNVELKQTARLDKDGNAVQQISEVFVGDAKIEINTTLLAQSSSGMLNKVGKEGEVSVKNESKKQAEEAMQYVDDIIRFFNEANYLNDTHVAMMLNGLNSDMKSPMRRAARFMYVVEGVETYKNPGQTLEYEHMIPAQWQMMRHVAQVRDGSLTKENLSELYDQYTVAIIPRVMDLVIKNSGFNATMQPGYEVGQHSSGRYYNLRTLGRSNMFAIRELGTDNMFGEYHQTMAGNFDYNYKNYQNADKAINTVLASEEVRGMSTFDFDETLIDKGDNFIIAEKDGNKIKITSAAWPIQGPALAEQGYNFDFSDFINVRGGVAGPLMTKFKNQIAKYGIDNVFILTARPAESAPAIKSWLETQGVNMPIENITGLGNSTGEAKAMWMLEKFAEGYNDMYFVDDALPNVKAVKNVLNQLDIKSKVRQAIPLASEEISNTFNDILEDVTGIESKKRFSQTKARKRGAKKGRFRLFIPPSHEDFIGLLYNFMGKGEVGNKHREFFENTLVRPLNRAYKELNAAKQAIATDYKNLIKNSGDIKKKLRTKLADGDFTFEDAVRVYLWDKHSLDIPGIAPTDQKKLVEAVMMDQKLRMFAEVLNVISKQDEYIAPYDGWEGGSIKTDLNEAMGATGRKKFFEQFLNNANTIFSPENLNKIEAAYGPNFREALEDMLYRIETGRNRPQGQGRMLNKFMNWLNGSVASVMFLNMRSALLQQMSIVNFINFADNNIYAAAKAFANQKQYWSDWAYIFNSDFLKERRKGIGTDINGNDLARSLQDSRNPMAKLFQMLLRAGFAPTQIADNVAIATGGSTFYRNRINSYLKDGLSQKEAERRAFEDFQEIAEETQQSAREDKVSMQQASWVGKVILNFQNVTSQYNRIGKRSFLDIKNRRISKGYKDQRTSDLANISRIAYYFAVQNLIFYGLQSALFAAMFDDEEEGLSEEEKIKRKKVLDKKSERIINGSIDSVLRGSGIFGAIISVLKNMAIKYTDERNKKYNPDESAVLMEALNVSPVVGIKARKIVIAEKTMNYDKKLIEYMDTWDIDNPMWQANFAYTEAITNAPLAKTHNKVQNVRDAIQLETTMLNRILMFFGYSKYNLGVEENIEMQLLEQKAKEASKEKKRKKKKTQQPTFSF